MRIQSKLHGFATVTALVLVMVIGITISCMVTRISQDARRARREYDRAQQEQVDIARAHDANIKLPVELQSKRIR